MAKETKTKPEYNTMKYLCPACTNEAFYCNEGDEMPADVKCPKCGKVTPFDETRLVKLPKRVLR